MKRSKALVSLIVALLLVLTMSPATALAAGTGTENDPYIGGKEYQSGDHSIVLNKLDIGGFERRKAAELKLAVGVTVIFTSNENPTGLPLVAGDIVGSYALSTDPSTKVADVTLGELTALAKITFNLQQVELKAGSTIGSTNPSDYALKSGGINEHAKTNDTGMITWSGLAAGYYKVSELSNDTGQPVDKQSFIVALPMLDPADHSKTIKTVHVFPKNRTTSGPVIEKEQPSVEDYNGNILSWTLKAEIPSSFKKDKGNQTYVVTDTMSNGITYAGNLRLYYKKASDGTEVTLDKSNYDAPASVGASSFTITLNAAGFTTLGTALQAGEIAKENGKDTLYVTYDTVINISPEDLENQKKPNNTVELEFTNSDGTKYENEDEPVELTKYAGIKLTKKDGSSGTLLPNATFKIYTGLKDGKVDPDKVLKNAAGTGDLELTTGTDGTFTYRGLGAGNYYLKETAAPTNYVMLNDHFPVTITEDHVTDQTVLTSEVLNYLNPGGILPKTGGAGTFALVLVGIALIASAGLVLVRTKKRNQVSEPRNGDTSAR